MKLVLFVKAKQFDLFMTPTSAETAPGRVRAHVRRLSSGKLAAVVEHASGKVRAAARRPSPLPRPGSASLRDWHVAVAPPERPVRVYTGQTRSDEVSRELASYGIGECTVRGELDRLKWDDESGDLVHMHSVRRAPWFYDNGAFRDWKAGAGFDFIGWERDMRRLGRLLEMNAIVRPDFVVAPDLVAGGRASLEFSRQYRGDVPPNVPVYLAVQDGMSVDDVRKELDDGRYQGIFVGGSKSWKHRTLTTWVKLAHETGRGVHVGRMGTPRLVAAAVRAGVDSLDSSFPLWRRDRLRTFAAALDAGDPAQMEIV